MKIGIEVIKLYYWMIFILYVLYPLPFILIKLYIKYIISVWKIKFKLAIYKHFI